MLGVPQGDSSRHHDRGDGAQPLHGLSCVVAPTHMGVAGGEPSYVLAQRTRGIHRGFTTFSA